MYDLAHFIHDVQDTLILCVIWRTSYKSDVAHFTDLRVCIHVVKHVSFRVVRCFFCYIFFLYLLMSACVCTCESTYIYMYTSMCTYMCVCVCVCVCVHSLSLPHSPHEYTHAPSGLIRRASWTREHTLTHSPSHTHTHTNSLSFSLKHTHLLSGPYREGLIDTNTHTHPLSHTHTHTLSLSLSLSNTHTHCMALIGRALWTRLPRLSWIPAQGNIVGVRGRFLPYTHIYIYAHMYICIYGDIRRRHRGFWGLFCNTCMYMYIHTRVCVYR